MICRPELRLTLWLALCGLRCTVRVRIGPDSLSEQLWHTLGDGFVLVGCALLRGLGGSVVPDCSIVSLVARCQEFTLNRAHVRRACVTSKSNHVHWCLLVHLVSQAHYWFMYSDDIYRLPSLWVPYWCVVSTPCD